MLHDVLPDATSPCCRLEAVTEPLPAPPVDVPPAAPEQERTFDEERYVAGKLLFRKIDHTVE